MTAPESRTPLRACLERLNRYGVSDHRLRGLGAQAAGRRPRFEHRLLVYTGGYPLGHRIMPPDPSVIEIVRRRVQARDAATTKTRTREVLSDPAGSYDEAKTAEGLGFDGLTKVGMSFNLQPTEWTATDSSADASLADCTSHVPDASSSVAGVAARITKQMQSQQHAQHPSCRIPCTPDLNEMDRARLVAQEIEWDSLVQEMSPRRSGSEPQPVALLRSELQEVDGQSTASLTTYQTPTKIPADDDHKVDVVDVTEKALYTRKYRCSEHQLPSCLTEMSVTCALTKQEKEVNELLALEPLGKSGKTAWENMRTKKLTELSSAAFPAPQDASPRAPVPAPPSSFSAHNPSLLQHAERTWCQVRVRLSRLLLASSPADGHGDGAAASGTGNWKDERENVSNRGGGYVSQFQKFVSFWISRAHLGKTLKQHADTSQDGNCDEGSNSLPSGDAGTERCTKVRSKKPPPAICVFVVILSPLLIPAAIQSLGISLEKAKLMCVACENYWLRVGHYPPLGPMNDSHLERAIRVLGMHMPMLSRPSVSVARSLLRLCEWGQEALLLLTQAPEGKDGVRFLCSYLSLVKVCAYTMANVCMHWT